MYFNWKNRGQKGDKNTEKSVSIRGQKSPKSVLIRQNVSISENVSIR